MRYGKTELPSVRKVLYILKPKDNFGEVIDKLSNNWEELVYSLKTWKICIASSESSEDFRLQFNWGDSNVASELILSKSVKILANLA